MIHLAIRITNPFDNRQHKFVDVFSSTRKVSKNKNFEIEIQSNHDTLFAFDISLAFKGYDHAGPSISLTVLGFYIGLQVYDSRHWDYEGGHWENVLETMDSE